VEHGKTGFLVHDEHEMAAMVDKAGELDPMECRRGAERFSPDRIAAGYEEVYRRTIDARYQARAEARPAGAPAR
ncbi:MAG: hypothetical protein QOG35_2888, partial [Solirubrobacteraceae bacterium]|nr:hypothetical protein [Solirubrobacteraceae bacterium]